MRIKVKSIMCYAI